MRRLHLGGAGGVLLMAVIIMMVKQRVEDQERNFKGLTRKVFVIQEELHLLRAEQAYLNDLSRIDRIARKDLGLVPGTPTNYMSALPKAGMKNWHDSCKSKACQPSIKTVSNSWSA